MLFRTPDPLFPVQSVELPREQRGVKRRNRKRRPTELQTVVVSMRLSQSHKAKLLALGRGWLERHLDATEMPALVDDYLDQAGVDHDMAIGIVSAVETLEPPAEHRRPVFDPSISTEQLQAQLAELFKRPGEEAEEAETYPPVAALHDLPLPLVNTPLAERTWLYLCQRVGERRAREAIRDLVGDRRPYPYNVARVLGLTLPAERDLPKTSEQAAAEAEGIAIQIRRTRAIRAAGYGGLAGEWCPAHTEQAQVEAAAVTIKIPRAQANRASEDQLHEGLES